MSAQHSAQLENSLRSSIASARRIVVKIGSSSLTDEAGSVSAHKIHVLSEVISHRIAAGTEVVLVSSGAIASGLEPLKLDRKPRDLATKQAAAAAGQVLLAQHWAEGFATHGVGVAQILLTAEDISQRTRARNAQRTIDRLCQLHAVSIINENDTVATSEVQFGDNDRLAALTAHLVGAEALYLFSDVNGLYTAPPGTPRAQFISYVASSQDLENVQAGEGGALGTGGMATKVTAATMAAESGIPVLLGAAAEADKALNEASGGTVFAPSENKKPAWKSWALHAADINGTLYVDVGAALAIQQNHKSLLPVGITHMEGEFSVGDIVAILGPSGKVLGHGETHYTSEEVATMLGKKTEELPEHLRKPVVHTDYLSLVK